MSAMRNRFWLLVALCVALMVTACGGGGDANSTTNTTDTAVSTIQTMSAAQGGSLIVRNKENPLFGMQIDVLPNTLEGSQEEIQISWSNELPNQFNTDIMSDGTRVSQKTIILKRTGVAGFAKPVIVKVPVDKLELNGRFPTVLYWDESLFSYNPMDIVNVDRDASTVTFITSHFSTFVLTTTPSDAATITSKTKSNIPKFDPAINGFPQPNITTIYNPDGVCDGLVGYAKWYFRTNKTPSLSQAYNDGDPNSLFDDSVSREIFSAVFNANPFNSNIVINKSTGETINDQIKKYFSSSLISRIFTDNETALQILKQLDHGPQILSITTDAVKKLDGSTTNNGHVVLVYGYEEILPGVYSFHIYDPNEPKKSFDILWSSIGGFSLDQYNTDAGNTIPFKFVRIQSEETSYLGNYVFNIYNQAKSKTLNTFDTIKPDIGFVKTDSDVFCVLNINRDVCTTVINVSDRYKNQIPIYDNFNPEPNWGVFYKSQLTKSVPLNRISLTGNTAKINFYSASTIGSDPISIAIAEDDPMQAYDDLEKGHFKKYRAYKNINLTVAPLIIEYTKTSNVGEYQFVAKIQGRLGAVLGDLNWDFGDGPNYCNTNKCTSVVTHTFTSLPATISATLLINPPPASGVPDINPATQVTIDRPDVPPTTARPLILEFGGLTLHSNESYGAFYDPLLWPVNCRYGIGQVIATSSSLGNFVLTPKCVNFNYNLNYSKSLAYGYFYNFDSPPYNQNVRIGSATQSLSAKPFKFPTWNDEFIIVSNSNGGVSAKAGIYKGLSNTYTAGPNNYVYNTLVETDIGNFDKNARSQSFLGGDFRCNLSVGTGPTVDTIVYDAVIPNALVNIQNGNISVTAKGFNHSINILSLISQSATTYEEVEFYDIFRYLEVIAQNKETYFVGDSFDLTRVATPQREVYIVTMQSDGTYRASDCYGTAIPW